MRLPFRVGCWVGPDVHRQRSASRAVGLGFVLIGLLWRAHVHEPRQNAILIKDDPKSLCLHALHAESIPGTFTVAEPGRGLRYIKAPVSAANRSLMMHDAALERCGTDPTSMTVAADGPGSAT